MSALLSSTFWLLLNTPMVPPDPKTRTKSVQMVDLNRTRSKRNRRSPSTSSVESDHSSVAVSDTDAPAS